LIFGALASTYLQNLRKLARYQYPRKGKYTMGFRDLIFGKEEEEPTPPKSKEKEDDDADLGELGNLDYATPAPKKPVTAAPPVQVAPSVMPAELAAEVKAVEDLMQQEKKEKGLGLEYFGFLKALGNEDDDDAYPRTLRTLNSVREQFAVGNALTWKSLVDSAKGCMAWLATHSQQKVAKLQAEHQTASANHTVQIQKAATAIQENEQKILRLQREIEEQKALQLAASEAQKKAAQEFERKKNTMDDASVQLANDIAADIARFQGQH
jgi:hypothetical protein